MELKDALIQYSLRIADSSLILGQRMAEWCSNGPTLEEDIALSNISLDLFGQSRMLLSYAADLKGNDESEDTLAFHRNEREYFNCLITELPNGHFGDTIVRNFFFDAYCYHLYNALKESKDETLAAFGEKSLKEVTYHLRHNSEWIIRLANGTEESINKIKQSVIDIWPYTGDMFAMDEVDELLIEKSIAIDLNTIKSKWNNTIKEVFERANLEVPSIDVYMQTGSLKGIHTEHLGHMLGEMQYIPRAYPNMEW